jgi:alanine racemase
MSLGSSYGTSILRIDLGALVENWHIMKAQTRHGRSAAVVKADGYGLGLSAVGNALADAGCDTFFVAHLDEGIALRKAIGPKARIAVMNGLMAGTESVCLDHNLWPCLNDPGQIALWTSFCRCRESRLPAVLHCDTGMSRTGLDRKEAEQLIAAPEKLLHMDLRFIMSHMACADEPSHPMNRDQQRRFADLVNRLPSAAEGAMLAASSASFLGPDWHFDWIRPGVCLYGVRPNRMIPNPMKPVVTLEAQVLQVRQIDAGESVGYGASYKTGSSMRIATIAAGYADGFPRSRGNGAGNREETNNGHGNNEVSAWLGDKKLPLVGRVSMDLVMLDATHAPEIETGTMVSLIGPKQDVDCLAEKAGTIGYEILTSFGARYQRQYIGGQA